MQIFLVILTLACVVAVAALILKRVNPIFTFFISGVLILLVATLIDGESVLGDDTLGNAFLDVFGEITASFSSTVSGVGAIIMTVTGYAVYMAHIKSSDKLAYVATRPLGKLKNPYLVLSGVFVVGCFLKLVITSQAGVAMLLLASTFPILTAIGIHPLTAASLLTLVCFDWGPVDGSTLFAAKTAEMDVVDLFVRYQFKVVLVAIVVLAILIPIYYSRVDRRAIERGDEQPVEKTTPTNPDVPGWYALLPALPIVIVVVSYFLPTIDIDVVTANFISLLAVFVIEMIRRKDWRQVPGDMAVVCKAMGTAFANVVMIIISASVFAAGINKLGGITIIADAASDLRGAAVITIVLMAVICFGAAMIMGSGAASWFAFGPLAPGIAAKLGVAQIGFLIPMELGAAIGRAASPVAGATIAIAGYAGQDVMSVVKRTLPLQVISFATVLVASLILN
ncbi:anaerobic C4-dicarboxylate transporter DcuC [Brooklawnia cerclae]|uniref:DcuC family C4-dicarboxylate transporter n=1 Tax=Brooklawnia cerclae TaxID=349934 RepID=A0ABX0SFD4_9ACTN|nr:C4-dicarboxylate transporter DcuC [Brooklawnia cerclae]NIH56710.1 DcuC family C4-dicarboxylate transporter [Brooklawnia cerclae]